MPTPANSTNTMPTPTSPAMLTRSSASLLQQPNPTSPARLTRSSASVLQQPNPTSPARLTRSTASLFQQTAPTTGGPPSIVVGNSPGGQSSRQSNEINEVNDHFDGANCSQHETSGEPDEDLVPVPRNVRKKTMGHGLERMIKRGNKMPIQLRPDVPVQAAKLASECGVALRDNLPIYTSWKQYKDMEGQEEVAKVLRKVASRLDADVRNDGPSKAACTDIIKKGVKQQRYLLKRKYFDESLTREQMLAKEPPPNMKAEEWNKLVDYWCDPKVQEHCAMNKDNRGKVRLHQKTGARSYVAHRYSLRAKYNMEPDPVEFFGECMTSPRNGRTELANQIYEDMVAEKEREPEEGEAQKSPTQIVADSLSQISPSSTFLPNMGVTRESKTARSTSATEALLRSQFEATIQAEREDAARKQE